MIFFPLAASPCARWGQPDRRSPYPDLPRRPALGARRVDQVGCRTRMAEDPSPSDFVRRIDNPWFPLNPGSRWHYHGVDSGGRFTDNMRVTHRTKKIEGVRVTVVHDVVRKHGKPLGRSPTTSMRRITTGTTPGISARTRGSSTVTATPPPLLGLLQGRSERRTPGRPDPGSPEGRSKGASGVLQGPRRGPLQGPRRQRARLHALRVLQPRGGMDSEWLSLEPRVRDNKWYVHGVGDVKEKTVKGPKEILPLVSFHRGR